MAAAMAEAYLLSNQDRAIVGYSRCASHTGRLLVTAQIPLRCNGAIRAGSLVSLSLSLSLCLSLSLSHPLSLYLSFTFFSLRR